MAFCYKCGHKLEDDALYCINCGAKQDEKSNSSKTVEVESSSEHHKNNRNVYQNTRPIINSSKNCKNRILAGVLNIIVSGIGRIYLGYIGKGVAQLLLSIFVAPIGQIWAIIDGIMILTGKVNVDSSGVPLE